MVVKLPVCAGSLVSVILHDDLYRFPSLLVGFGRCLRVVLPRVPPLRDVLMVSRRIICRRDVLHGTTGSRVESDEGGYSPKNDVLTVAYLGKVN